MTSKPPTFEEWYDSHSGFATDHGEPEFAEMTLEHFRCGRYEDAFRCYKKFKSWSAHVPFQVAYNALYSLAKNKTSDYFDIVYEKEDTHLQLRALKFFMTEIERENPWLKWIHLVDWNELEKSGPTHLVNPKFLKDLYSYDVDKQYNYYIDELNWTKERAMRRVRRELPK